MDATDTISRQAALDMLDEQIELCNKALSAFDISLKDEYAVKVEKASLKAYKEQLENMPSAQPEIIRCKDCKHWDAEWSVSESGAHYCPMVDGNRNSDFYCADAERRTE